MICKRVLNNNVILAEDTSFQEYILIGRGLGLSSKPRIQVAMQQVEKRFVLDSKELSTKFQTFLAEIPGNHLALSNEIITMAETELSCTFSSETYIALADHITYVIKRSKQNKEIKNALLWEIKKLYPKEYQTGLKAVQMLRSYEKIKMGEDEAGFIALHFVNGQNLETSMEKTLKISNIISDIVAVIKENLDIDIDEESISFNRLITHLRFLAQRICNDQVDSTYDDFLFEQVREKFPETLAISYEIARTLQKKYDTILSVGETTYITLHLQRILDRSKGL